MHCQHTILVPFFLLSGLAAQSVVVPNANANVRNNAQLNSIIRNAGNPRVYQWGVNASELAGIPIGAVITGVSLRFSTTATNTASWPPADITWNTYEIWAGEATPTATWVADPMQNFLLPPRQVRSGPMTLDANSFSNLNPPGTTPNPWSEFYFDFQQPYLYLGGDLAMLFAHPGSNDTALALFPETVPSSAAVHGVGRSQSVYPVGTNTVATTFYVMRVHYGFGFGCAGSNNQTPVLVQSGNTEGGLGGTINLQIGNAPANSAAAIVFGLGNASIPLPNGCNLLVNPLSTVVVFTNNNGRAALPFVVPPSIQAAFHVQGAVLDAGANGGFTVTNSVAPTAN
jgi:hypothetical protein